MSLVDDRLRQAFGTADEEWVRRAPAAHGELRARHRRQRLVRLGAAASVAAIATAVVVAVTVADSGTRTIQPADPTPSSVTPTGATPLEGTWVSGPLRPSDVRAATRAAGAPAAATAMLENLPSGEFRVVMVVRGSSVQTLIRTEGAEDALVDEEVISTTGQELELRTLFGDARASLHGWTVRGDELTMTFRSTTEERVGGVPGEAWQRLLYDTAAFTR